MGLNEKLERGVNFLCDMGYDKARVRSVLEKQTVTGDSDYDLDSAIMDLERGAENTNRALINVPTDKEDAIAKVLADSLKNAPAAATDNELNRALQMSIKDNEDAELKRAMQMSIASQSNGPQPMDIDMNGQPKMSDEERAMAEAIEKSLESSVSAGISVNPASMKRDPGVPVGLKNVGNTCYVNSLLQTYFMLPALRNAILSFVPPPLPAAPAPTASTTSPTPSSTSPSTPSPQQPATQNPTPMDATPSSSAPPNSPVNTRRAGDAQENSSGAQQVQGPVTQQEALKNSEQDLIEFMIELQRLFANLVLSAQKYVDPSHMLKKLKDKSGNTLKIGNQEDVVEFNDLFLETVQRGLNLNRNPAQANVNQDFIKNMFYGNSAQLISGKEEDSSNFEISSDSVFNHLILRVGKDLPDLFSSLDAHVCDTVDYTTEKGFKTKANSTTWFRKTPPILMFQQSRVGFDPEKKTYSKSLAPLNFDKEIYMDRYLLENRAETTRIRGIVNSWRDELMKHEEELRKFTHYEGDCGLDQAMIAMIRYYQGKSEEHPQARKIIEQLQHDYQTESQHMRTLRDVIGNLRSQIATAYDHMKTTPYELYAVWVHQGVAGSGHYWAFLTDPRAGKWMRFNDMRVSDVVENEVMLESVGGHANSSAYFLIYVEKSMLNQVTDIFNYLPESLPIPDSLKADIADSNKKFHESLENAEKNSSENKVSKFVEKYKEKVADIEKKSKEVFPQDYRISTFWVFLISQGYMDMVLSDIVRQLYSVHFEKGIQMDIASANYNGVQEHVGKEAIELAVAMAVDTSKVDPLKQQHRIYQQITNCLCVGLSFMMDDRYDEAMKHMIFAVIRDSQIEHPAVRRTEELKQFVRVCLLKLIARIKFMVANSHVQQTDILVVQSNLANMILGHQDPITMLVSRELDQIANSVEPRYAPGFKFVATILSIPPTQNLGSYQHQPPAPPSLSSEEEVALMDRFVDVYKRFELNCSEQLVILVQMGLLQPKREEKREEGNHQVPTTPSSST